MNLLNKNPTTPYPLQQKNKHGGHVVRTYFFENALAAFEFLGFLGTLPLEIPDKTKFSLLKSPQNCVKPHRNNKT